VTLALWAQRFVVSWLCAEGLLVLASVKTINVALKRGDQRTPAERKRVEHGLFREFAGEVLLFVPISVMVATLVLRPMIARISSLPVESIDGLVGVVSYGFPYRTVKSWVLHACLRFLKEAVQVADKQIAEQASKKKGDG